MLGCFEGRGRQLVRLRDVVVGLGEWRKGDHHICLYIFRHLFILRIICSGIKKKIQNTLGKTYNLIAGEFGIGKTSAFGRDTFGLDTFGFVV